jgi:hypothetical protein
VNEQYPGNIAIQLTNDNLQLKPENEDQIQQQLRLLHGNLCRTPQQQTVPFKEIINTSNSILSVKEHML